MDLLFEAAALQRAGTDAIALLTEAATGVAFYREGLSEEQLAANRRIVAISGPSCAAAAASADQRFAAAFVGEALAGYVIATRHAPEDLELDWLMVHPDHHGSGIAATLMEAGIGWLGADRPLWLNVIAYNERAIRFYRKFGFEIDPAARTSHAVPHAIMRRPPSGS